MALKEVRKIQDRSKKVYLHYLVSKGKLKQYVSDKGYVCYDTDEYREYKKNVHMGRPLKQWADRTDKNK